jgi:hypothetical protein
MMTIINTVIRKEPDPEVIAKRFSLVERLVELSNYYPHPKVTISYKR